MQQTVKCPNCGKECAGLQFCTACGTRLSGASKHQVEEPPPAPNASPMAREYAPSRKYGALRAVATIYKIVGWVVVVGGTLFSIALAVIGAQGSGEFSDFIPWGTSLGMVGIAVVGVVVSILGGLFLVAFADLCHVLMDVERNTGAKE
jgi:hypothetical protein